MSATLGVSVEGATAYLAVLDEDETVRAAPAKYQLPAGLPRPVAVLDAIETLVNMINDTGASAVAVLDAQPNARPQSFAAARKRTNLEFLFELAAARAGVRFALLSPSTVASRLVLPDKRPKSHVDLHLRPSGPHWTNRGPAGLAALAETRNEEWQ